MRGIEVEHADGGAYRSAPPGDIGAPDMAAALLAWWDAVGQMARFWAGAGNPFAVGLAMAGTLLGTETDAAGDGRSWYRHPDSNLAGNAFWPSPYAGFAVAPTAWFPGWSAGWPTPSLGALGPVPMMFGAFGNGAPHRTMTVAAMPPMAQSFYAAWLEGASRAMLPRGVADTVEVMRRPQSNIPFVSYRSDGGHAVAQIGYTAALVFAALLPMLLALTNPGAGWV